MQSNYNLRPLWNAILDIYGELESILHSEKIKYWAGYGTVLGAVRHKGFIPWDDDFDLLMMRADYDRFIKIIENRLPKHLKLVYYKNTKECNFSFCKIVDVRKDAYEMVQRESKLPLPQGIYIDIFPIDNYLEGLVGFFFKIKIFFMLRTARVMGGRRINSIRSFVSYCIGLCSLPFFKKLRTEKDRIAWYESTMRNFMVKETRNVGRFNNFTHCYAYHHSRSAFLGVEMMPFENIKLPVPKGWDEHLRTIYGDYMKFPPEEERKPYHGNDVLAPWRFGPTGN